jgi:hypothetical protein
MQFIAAFIQIVIELILIIPGILPEKVWNVIAVIFWIGVFISLALLAKYLVLR